MSTIWVEFKIAQNCDHLGVNAIVTHNYMRMQEEFNLKALIIWLLITMQSHVYCL